MLETTTTRLGQLNCRILADAETPLEDYRRFVLLCHGFGAPGDDLVPLAHEVIRRYPESQSEIAYVFPAAPLKLDLGGPFDARAWWPLDMERLAWAVETGAIREMRSEHPEQLPEARRALESVVDDLLDRCHVSTEQILLGGFSQGAMLTTDVALSQDRPWWGLCVFSGNLLAESRWRELAQNHCPLRLFQSHGRRDPLLPFEGAEALRSMLEQAGHSVDFFGFPGMHTIPPEAVDGLVRLLK